MRCFTIARHFFDPFQGVEAVHYFAEDRVLAIKVRGRAEHDEKRSVGGIRLITPCHREHTAHVLAMAELGFEIMHPAVSRMSLLGGARGANAALRDKTRDDAMKERVVVPARLV